jgi:hypothetical protein
MYRQENDCAAIFRGVVNGLFKLRDLVETDSVSNVC